MPDLDRESQGLGRNPALILVDMINGFTDPDCPLGSEADTVVEANRRLLAAFRERGLHVFFTTVVYRSPDQAAVFRARVPALEVLHAAAPIEAVRVNEKRWASGFFGTDLARRLEQAGVDSLVVTGLTTSGCVRATAVDGLQHDYRVVIPKQAVGDRNPEAHRANLFDLNAKYADVLDLDEVLDMLGTSAEAAAPAAEVAER